LDLNDTNSKLRLPDNLLFKNLSKINKYKKYYEPTNDDELELLLEDNSEALIYNIFDIAVRNILTCSYKV